MVILDKPTAKVSVGRTRIQCRAKYGSKECKRPAKWRIVMACCGANDYLCNQCLEMASTDPQDSPYFTPGHSEYYGCESCAKLHPTWKSAVKEISKL